MTLVGAIRRYINSWLDQGLQPRKGVTGGNAWVCAGGDGAFHWAARRYIYYIVAWLAYSIDHSTHNQYAQTTKDGGKVEVFDDSARVPRPCHPPPHPTPAHRYPPAQRVHITTHSFPYPPSTNSSPVRSRFSYRLRSLDDLLSVTAGITQETGAGVQKPPSAGRKGKRGLKRGRKAGRIKRNYYC